MSTMDERVVVFLPRFLFASLPGQKVPLSMYTLSLGKDNQKFSM